VCYHTTLLLCYIVNSVSSDVVLYVYTKSMYHLRLIANNASQPSHFVLQFSACCCLVFYYMPRYILHERAKHVVVVVKYHPIVQLHLCVDKQHHIPSDCASKRCSEVQNPRHLQNTCGLIILHYIAACSCLPAR
jgi:hypothetical protein